MFVMIFLVINRVLLFQSLASASDLTPILYDWYGYRRTLPGFIDLFIRQYKVLDLGRFEETFTFQKQLQQNTTRDLEDYP
jgi:hypothetical protein